MLTMTRTVQSIVSSFPYRNVLALPVPGYRYRKEGPRAALAVPSMANHMSNEGWQLMLALESAGYSLCAGKIIDRVDVWATDVRFILQAGNPSVVVVQDKREWDNSPLCTPEERFINVGLLKERDDIFKVTILKDAHQKPEYHRKSAEEIGCHAWIVYYHPKIVKRLAPYVREEHLIRTYHSVDPDMVPDYSSKRDKCLLSGYIHGMVYPMRSQIMLIGNQIPGLETLKHPKYHANGTNTNRYLELLSRYKVAICTSSIYGYALRKLIEATACGCMVITDFPVDDHLPFVSENLFRIDLEPRHNFAVRLKELVEECYQLYNPILQESLAIKTKQFYSYQTLGYKLASDIENMRVNYAASVL